METGDRWVSGTLMVCGWAMDGWRMIGDRRMGGT